MWDGSNPQGRRILLYPEQGLGDTLHFIRMATELSRLGAHVIVQSPPALLAILQSVPGIQQLIPQGLPLPDCDIHASFIDAADLMRAGLPNFPAPVPYIRATRSLIDYWKRWADQLPAGKRIGICWQGNPEHQADHVRSIPLAAFEAVAKLPGVTLVSLQQGFGSEQLDRVAFGTKIVRLPDNVDKTSGAFQDTAAIMTHLDLIITSDTSIAHLAGALGRPTWLPLATIPDWRWLLHREDSPWYPQMRLFRQQHAGDWNEVFGRVAQALL